MRAVKGAEIRVPMVVRALGANRGKKATEVLWNTSRMPLRRGSVSHCFPS